MKRLCFRFKGTNKNLNIFASALLPNNLESKLLQCGPSGPGGTASPGKLLEMQTHCRATKSKALELRPGILYFNKLSTQFQCMLKNRCYKELSLQKINSTGIIKDYLEYTSF